MEEKTLSELQEAGYVGQDCNLTISLFEYGLACTDVEYAVCPYCYADYPDDLFDYYTDPTSYYYEQDGYACEQQADDTDVFILRSPFYTRCKFCSPCAPGAGYILDSAEDGIFAYCFGHDWFESGQAPYTVYSVETGEVVKP